LFADCYASCRALPWAAFGSYLLEILPSGVPALVIVSNGNLSSVEVLSGTVTVPLNQWSHVAVSVNAANIGTIFVDGAVAGTQQFLQKPSPSAVSLQIGNFEVQPNAVDVAFTGNIDEVRVSKSARYSAAFVPSKLNTSDADTVALFHFDELAGATAADSSSAANAATLSVGAAFAPLNCPLGVEQEELSRRAAA
jgi:hypothetical protein